MCDILQHLSRRYLQSTHGRRPSIRDFTIDYEKFLRDADAADGDAREISERALGHAAQSSDGRLVIDRHPRSRLPERVRLLHDGGEAWLFQQIDAPTPTSRRESLAASFREMAERPVPSAWQTAWTGYFLTLAASAVEGSSIHPFQTDPAANLAFTNTLAGILDWQGPSLVRYASAAICGDSKQIQKLESRLRTALAAITGSGSLEDFGILRKPRAVTLHGPFQLHTPTTTTDFSRLPGPVALSETNFPPGTRLTTTATTCLTIENEDTFHELAATNPGVLLVLTSYPGSAVRRLLALLPENLRFLHFGDADPAGSDILRDLRQKSGRDIQPLMIPGHQASPRRAPTGQEQSTLQRLLASDLPTALRDHLEGLLESGIPGDFEQEAIPIREVWEWIDAAGNRMD